jgi:hypothetical protein
MPFATSAPEKVRSAAVEPVESAAQEQAADEVPAAENTPAGGNPVGGNVEQLLEYACSRGLQPRVDAQAGVIAGVKILGLESRNGRVYRSAAIARAVTLYEGVKVNVNHPKGQGHVAVARDYQDRLGCLRNVRTGESGLFADLHFNPHHPLARQLAWDAEHSPENVGLSHNVQARTSRQGSQTIVEQILKVNSVDLVADPATTSSLFESADAAAAEAGRAVATGSRLSREMVSTLLGESRLPAEAITEAFVESLLETDQFAAKRLIDERARFFQTLTLSRARPKSKGPLPDAAGEIDLRRWARMIT